MIKYARGGAIHHRALWSKFYHYFFDLGSIKKKSTKGMNRETDTQKK